MVPQEFGGHIHSQIVEIAAEGDLELLAEQPAQVEITDIVFLAKFVERQVRLVIIVFDELDRLLNDLFLVRYLVAGEILQENDVLADQAVERVFQKTDDGIQFARGKAAILLLSGKKKTAHIAVNDDRQYKLFQDRLRTQKDLLLSGGLSLQQGILESVAAGPIFCLVEGFGIIRMRDTRWETGQETALHLFSGLGRVKGIAFPIKKFELQPAQMMEKIFEIGKRFQRGQVVEEGMGSH